MSFRRISDNFIENASQRKTVDNPAAVILQVRAWTRGELFLTELILKGVLAHDLSIASGEEEKKVGAFVSSHIIEKWSTNEAAPHFNAIRDDILNHSNKNSILLKLYSIIGSETVLVDESPEVSALLDSSLVVEEGKELNIHNPIYAAIFDRAWVGQQLNSQPAPVAVDQSSQPQRPSSQLLLEQFAPYISLRAVLLAVTTVLLSSALFLACQQRSAEPLLTDRSVDTPEDSNATDNVALPVDSPKQKMSSGEVALIESEELSTKNLGFRTAKSNGIAAIVAEDYEGAVAHFNEALIYYKNAPETLIYLNNARIQAENAQSYTIAAAVPISDDLPAAQAMLRGVAQSQDRINKSGGINGIPLKVVIVDDEGNKEKADETAAMIADRSEILGVVGHYYSSVTLEAEDTYKERELAIIALSSSVKISALDNDYIFRTSPSDAVIGKSLATHMLETLAKEKVAIVYNDKNAYSQSLKGAFESTVLAEGGKIVSDFDLSEGFNASKAVRQAIDRDAQVLMLIPSNLTELQDNVMPIARLNASEDEPLSLMGGDVVYSDTVLTEDFADMVVGAFWHVGAADPNSEFIIQSQQLWNAEVNWITAMSYDATQAWIEALEINTAEPTRRNLQAILSSSDDFFSADGASGSVEFSSNGDRPISGQLVKVNGDEDSEKANYRFTSVLRDE